MSKHVVIIGAGPAGIFSAYNLITSDPNIDVTVIDKGNDIYSRHCPMREKENQPCVHCKTCGIMHGFGGAGTFSDCKLSLTAKGVGGNIIDYVGEEKAQKLINDVELIYRHFDVDADKREVVGTAENKEITKIKEIAKKDSITYTECPTKHLGTDGTLKVMKYMYDYLCNAGVKFLFNTECTNVKKTETEFSVYTNKNILLIGDYVILAPGRSGNSWVAQVVNGLGIKTKSNKVDIGVRLETSYEIAKYLTDNLYDVKLSYIDPYTGDKVRSFCTNPKGYVSEEHYGFNAIANGHSFANKKSENTNFAVLVTLNDDRLNAKYIKSYMNIANNYSNGKLILQNCTDFMKDRPTKSVQDYQTNTVPTLSTAMPGDITAILPSRVCAMIKMFLQKLNRNLAKNIIWGDTWLYGIEAKFYSDLIEVDNNMETNVTGLYVIGDGSGTTRGITQSASEGLVASESILNKPD
mgnify:CR=1 FL=1